MARPDGSVNKVGVTDSGNKIYQWFIKPFLKGFTLTEDELEGEKGIEAFFDIENRKVVFCKATRSFTIPGPMWASPSQPYKLVPGVGRRYVTKGQGFVLRMDRATPDRSEVEFEEQVFVLSRAQLAAIQDFIKVVS